MNYVKANQIVGALAAMSQETITIDSEIPESYLKRAPGWSPEKGRTVGEVCASLSNDDLFQIALTVTNHAKVDPCAKTKRAKQSQTDAAALERARNAGTLDDLLADERIDFEGGQF